MRHIILGFILFIGFSLSSYGQTDNTLQHQIYYYTVEKVVSESQLSEVVHAFEDLKFVTKVKLNYKSEKPNKAQFVVYVSEPKRTSESQEMFEITDLKAILLNNDLTPLDFVINQQ